MKTIEKVCRDGNTQIFEILTSRKELAEFLKDTLHEWIYSEYAKDWHPDRVFDDVDTTVCFYDSDGKFTWIAEGEIVSRPNVSKIKRMMSTNGSTRVIYGDLEIVFNENYGDWEADFD